MTVMVYSESTDWTELAIPNYASNADWNFVSSGDMDLSQWKSEPYIRIAFRYRSTVSSSAKWEIKSVSVKAEPGSSGGGNGGADDSNAVNPGKLLGWMELPAYRADDGMYQVAHFAQMGGSTQRNYTIYYDASMYTSYWVAYPLCSDHLGSGRVETWGYDPNLPSSLQTSVDSGYGASVSTEYNSSNPYARGHQIPNADRTGVREMANQTYYSTNLTPQIQNGFNGDIGAQLEIMVRDDAKASGVDTVYVVTGAAFNKRGESKTVKYITNKNDGFSLPVPNYYYKVLLKVHRSGGSITAASAIGYWFEHRDYGSAAKNDYDDYAVSVDRIEEWTGFDFFANLSESLQTTAESNTSVSSFSSFR